VRGDRTSDAGQQDWRACVVRREGEGRQRRSLGATLIDEMHLASHQVCSEIVSAETSDRGARSVAEPSLCSAAPFKSASSETSPSSLATEAGRDGKSSAGASLADGQRWR
jgi:hypothetical protein